MMIRECLNIHNEVNIVDLSAFQEYIHARMLRN
jgi:hypothetical protein